MIRVEFQQKGPFGLWADMKAVGVRLQHKHDPAVARPQTVMRFVQREHGCQTLRRAAGWNWNSTGDLFDGRNFARTKEAVQKGLGDWDSLAC